MIATMRRVLCGITLVALGAWAGQIEAQAAPARGGSLDSLRARWRVQLPPGYLDVQVQPRAFPSMNASSPSAYSPEWGDAYVGFGYQQRTRPEPFQSDLGNNDGVAVVGFGLGLVRRVALEVEYASFSTFRSGFFNVGAMSFKLSHLFGNGWAVAAGAERVVTVGSEGDGGKAYFGAASKVFVRGDGTGPLSALGITVGAGNGRFRPVEDVWLNRQSVNAFGAVGLKVLDPLGLVADWNGQDLTLAASVVPFRCIGLTISPAITDVTGNAQSPRRYVIGVGIGGAVSRRGLRPRGCS